MPKQRRNRCGYSVKYPKEEGVYRGISKIEYMVRKKFGPYTYWRAEISYEGKRKYKTFKTKEEAIAQRKRWEKEIPL